MKCKECNKECKNFKALSTHIQFKHDKKTYYDNYMKKEGEGFCKTCNHETKFVILGRGYEIFCSKECEKIDYSIRMSNNNPMFLDKAKNNQQKTNLKKYGVKQNTQRPEIKKQIKKTNLKKYGVENVAQNKLIKSKAKQSRETTCLNKYGVKSYLEVESVKRKIKKTMIERYGVEFAQQSEIIKKKTRETNKRKYGVEFITQNKDIFEKAQKTVDGLNHIKIYFIEVRIN